MHGSKFFAVSSVALLLQAPSVAAAQSFSPIGWDDEWRQEQHGYGGRTTQSSDYRAGVMLSVAFDGSGARNASPVLGLASWRGSDRTEARSANMMAIEFGGSRRILVGGEALTSLSNVDVVYGDDYADLDGGEIALIAGGVIVVAGVIAFLVVADRVNEAD